MQHGDFVSLLLSVISHPKEEQNLPEITKQKECHVVSSSEAANRYSRNLIGKLYWWRMGEGSKDKMAGTRICYAEMLETVRFWKVYGKRPSKYVY
jgi:hypothetical protein